MVGKANVWEDFCTPVEVEPNTDYILMFKFCCPSGYTRANWEHRRAYIWDSTWVYASGENSLTDSRLLGYSAPWTNGASSVLQDYSVTFNSGNNKRIRIQFGFGDCYDEARVRMVFAGFRLKKVI